MGAMAEVKKPNNTIDKLALIVTTYKRQQLLETLFDSILALEQAPWRIVIVDNEQSDQTADMVAAFAGKVTGQWSTTVADQSGNEERVVYAPQTENLGGAGGFSAGVAKAYELGAAWFWVMDDDVAVLPDAIAKLAKWTDKHEVIQGSRFDYDGGPFYWQYDFIVPLGIPNPIAPRRIWSGRVSSDGHADASKAACSTAVWLRKSVCRTRASSSTGMTRCMATAPARSPTRLWCPT